MLRSHMNSGVLSVYTGLEQLPECPLTRCVVLKGRGHANHHTERTQGVRI